MSSANSAQQAFYKNKNNKGTGPSSAAKSRRGGKQRQKENKIEITDFDLKSCFLGSIEQKFSEWNAIVKNLKDDTLVNCKARGFKMKFVSVKTPVVFATSGSKNGEIICYYTPDNLRELCEHFGVNYEKASKECGIVSSHDVADDLEEEVVIASQAKEKVKKDTGSSSDSLEPNPNHRQKEEDDEEEEEEEEEVIESKPKEKIKKDTGSSSDSLKQEEVEVIESKPKEKIKKDTGSSSDSLEPNPNHRQKEEDDEEEEDKVVLSEEQIAKLNSIETNYSVEKKPRGNKKNQDTKRKNDRKKKFTGVGFRYE